MLEHALAYARVGWRVFPIADKVPLTDHGHLDATTDLDRVRAWWAIWPDAWIGVYLRASGLVCVDVDVRPAEGVDGFASLAYLEKMYGPLPRALTAKSGGNGLHVFMKDPAPGDAGWTRTAELGGKVRAKPATGIDFKCNGYVVLAPSGKYKWTTGALADVRQPPAVPAAWLPALQRDDSVRLDGGVEGWDENDGAAWEAAHEVRLRARLERIKRQRGASDPTLVAARVVFHDFGRSVRDGYPYFQEWNDDCGKPYTGRELDRQLHRCARYASGWHERRPRGWATLDIYERAALAEAARRAP